jgi:hypothetical protein
MALSTACKTAVERGKEQDAFNSTSEYLDFVPSVIAGNGEEETKEYDAMS